MVDRRVALHEGLAAATAALLDAGVKSRCCGAPPLRAPVLVYVLGAARCVAGKGVAAGRLAENVASLT